MRCRNISFSGQEMEAILQCSRLRSYQNPNEQQADNCVGGKRHDRNKDRAERRRLSARLKGLNDRVRLVIPHRKKIV